MRYSICFAWCVAVLSICVLTMLASLPGFTKVERPADTTILVGVHGSRSIKIQRVRCNVMKATCQTARHKLQPKAPA